MPNWLKVAAGLALAVSLIAVAALRAYSGMLGPLVVPAYPPVVRDVTLPKSFR